MVHPGRSRLVPLFATGGLLLLVASLSPRAQAHIVPPEELHPVAESYRRLAFTARLNPVPWESALRDAQTVVSGLADLDPAAAAGAQQALDELAVETRRESPLEPVRRREIAAALVDTASRAAARALAARLERAERALADHSIAAAELEEARQLWAAFEPTVRESDPEAFRRLGESWLELSNALGTPGLLGFGAIAADRERFERDAVELTSYVDEHFAGGSVLGAGRMPARLPPGSNVNKQLPRPRQVLNMATRGVDESETVLIALGDMAFDSPEIFGEPARSLAISCNTCHNKSITNPDFFIPGLSARPGGLDVSNSFFAPHANNGHFDPVDIPDLRGIRFTSPYGRNGRFESLRDFVRNVIVNEFNGAEPDPLMLDGLIAYMLEFDFLPNPALEADGTLNEQASPAARRGEEIFHRPYAQMGGRSCASCHVPSDHFLDRRRHDIGSTAGSEPGSRDRALDTPTLLSASYTAPYFHDGRLPTLKAVAEWFDGRYGLGMTQGELEDLTTYLETVGGGVEAYEDTIHTLEAEMEEFSFFLSSYEFLRQREKLDLIETLFATVAFEIRAHKWDVQDRAYLPVLDQLAALMDESRAAVAAGDLERVDLRVNEYRRLYQENVDHLN